MSEGKAQEAEREEFMRAARIAADSLVYLAWNAHPHGEYDPYTETFEHEEGFDYRETCDVLCGAEICDNCGCIEMKLRDGLALQAALSRASLAKNEKE